MQRMIYRPIWEQTETNWSILKFKKIRGAVMLRLITHEDVILHNDLTKNQTGLVTGSSNSDIIKLSDHLPSTV